MFYIQTGYELFMRTKETCETALKIIQYQNLRLVMESEITGVQVDIYGNEKF